MRDEKATVALLPVAEGNGAGLRRNSAGGLRQGAGEQESRQPRHSILRSEARADKSPEEEVGGRRSFYRHLKYITYEYLWFL